MLDTFVAVLSNLLSHHKLVASVSLVAVGLLVRWIAILHFKRLPSDENDLARRWSNSAKNAINLVILSGLIIIWLSELRFVALSIATFIVALVIATREFIQCFVGSLYQASARTFSIGDWIKVNNHCGEVVASNWLSTSLMEINIESAHYEYTGRTLFVPNNQFVANTIYNLNFMKRFVTHSFTIVREPEPVNLTELKPFILEKAKEYCTSFEAVATRYNSLIESKLGVSIPGPEPTVKISTTNLGKTEFTVSIFCPTQQVMAIEQQLMADFMQAWHQKVEDYRSRQTPK
ncbi:MAG: mechanosensitive ion channel family protein [Pseudomonadales bacterium]|nr:mechanosensitive ion channel family protein [Pseudomonadales bacterium]